MIVCKVCGATNEQGATFCGTCGAFLEWSGEAVQPDGSTQPVSGQPGGVPPVPPPVGPSRTPRPETPRRRPRSPDRRDRRPTPRRRARSSARTAGWPTTRRASTARAAPRSSRPSRRPSPPVVAAPPHGPRDPARRDPAAIGGVAVIAVLAFVFLLPKSPPDTGIDTAIPSLADVAARRPPIASAHRPQPSASAGASPSAEPSARRPCHRPSRAATSRCQVLADGDANIVVFTFDGEKQTKLVGGKKSTPSRPGVLVRRRRGSSTCRQLGPSDPIKASTGEGIRARQGRRQRRPKVPDFTHHDVDRNPAWSPDGSSSPSRRRATTQNGKNLDIYVRPVKDTTDEPPRGRPGRRLGPGLCPGRRHDRVRLESATGTRTCSR